MADDAEDFGGNSSDSEGENDVGIEHYRGGDANLDALMNIFADDSGDDEDF